MLNSRSLSVVGRRHRHRHRHRLTDRRRRSLVPGECPLISQSQVDLPIVTHSQSLTHSQSAFGPANDERRMTNDERPNDRTTNDERRTTNDERRTTNDERRTTERPNDERWTTNDERRTTIDGQWTMTDDVPSFVCWNVVSVVVVAALVVCCCQRWLVCFVR